MASDRVYHRSQVDGNWSLRDGFTFNCSKSVCRLKSEGQNCLPGRQSVFQLVKTTRKKFSMAMPHIKNLKGRTSKLETAVVSASVANWWKRGLNISVFDSSVNLFASGTRRSFTRFSVRSHKKEPQQCRISVFPASYPTRQGIELEYHIAFRTSAVVGLLQFIHLKAIQIPATSLTTTIITSSMVSTSTQLRKKQDHRPTSVQNGAEMAWPA